MEQFTANEVRDAIMWKYGDKLTRISAMLTAFADLLEARERAVPVAIVKDSDALYTGFLSWTDESVPPETKLYTHPPSPSDAERLAEALRELADKWEQRDYNASRARNAAGHDHAMELRQALAAHSAQAQPPAASVSEVTGLTWEAPDVTINVEQVGRFRSGDEHIVRVTFRSSDDGRRMTCFYSANESAVGYLHAMLAAQENPNG